MALENTKSKKEALKDKKLKDSIREYQIYTDEVTLFLSQGKCLLCSVFKNNNSFVKFETSHSVPKAIIKKMTSSKVYQIQNNYILYSSILDELKNNILQNIQYYPKPAGTFYNLCGGVNGCEKSEDYEGKLGENILSSFNTKDYTEIYIKSLCAAKYRNDFSKNMFFKIKKDLTKDYFHLNNNRFFVIENIIQKELEYKKEDLDLIKNNHPSIKNQSMVIFDSAEYNVEIPALKISASSFYTDTDYFFYSKNKEANNISIFIVSDKKKTRVILMGENKKQSTYLRNLFFVLFQNDPLIVVKAILYTMVYFRFEGVLFTDDCDMKKIYQMYKESRIESDNFIFQFDEVHGFSLEMQENLYKIDNFLKELVY